MNVNTWGPVNTWNVVQADTESPTGGFLQDPYYIADKYREQSKAKPQKSVPIKRIKKTGVIKAESVDRLDLVDVEIEHRKAIQARDALEKQKADHNTLIAIYLSIQALVYRKQQIEEADIAFIIAMLAV